MSIPIQSAYSQEDDVPGDGEDGTAKGLPADSLEDVTTCSLTQFDPNCSPSGWISFIIGDLALAVGVAILIYKMQHRTSAKMTEAVSFIQKIIKREEESRRRQMIFVTQSLKNYFSVILMIAGLMNRSLIGVKAYEDIPQAIREKEEEMIRMAGHSNDTLNLAAHILDPVLTEQIRRLLSQIEKVNPQSGIGKGFPKYDEIKKEIVVLTQKLDTVIGNVDRVLK